MLAKDPESPTLDRADFGRTVVLDREQDAGPYNPRTDSFSPVVADELVTCPHCGGCGQVMLRIREVRRD